MSDGLRELNRKLDEIVGRQERTISLVTMQLQQGGSDGQQKGVLGDPVAQQGFSGDSIRRNEVDMIINNQNLLINTLREVR